MKLEKLVNSGIPILCGALLVIIVGLIFLQVVLRNCFALSMNWSDEISQFSLTWLILLGAIWGTKNGQHLNTGIKLQRKLNEKLVQMIDGILALVIIIFVAVVAYQGAIFAFTVMGIASMSLPWLKMGCVFIVLPIAMLSMCYYYVKFFFKNLVSIFKKD
jgi:TRAP-type C4-dicarboxylate transport system permease small subunit